MSVSRVQTYLSTSFPKIPGWLSERFMLITGHLAEEMMQAGAVGGACEIGVFRGKFIIGLSHAVEGRPSLAIDLFDNQSENVDGSGAGALDMLGEFRRNVAAHAAGPIADMVANSFALTLRDRIALLDRFGPFQFFSVDGGHLAEHVVNDYAFAQEVAHHGGAIIIDDIANPGWPGVMEGVATILFSTRPKFVPLMIGHNKLVLVGASFHDRYFHAMKARIETRIPEQTVWTRRFFGHETLCLV